MSTSVVLIADGRHALSDSLTALLMIAGIRFFTQRPDKKYSFGYGRREQIVIVFFAPMRMEFHSQG